MLRIALACFVAVVLVVFGPAAPLWADALPIKIKLPSGCQLQKVEGVTWVCKYTMDNGRNRAVVLNFFEFVLTSEDSALLRKMSAAERERTFTNEIIRIDRDRDAQRTPGDYHRWTYEFLVDVNRPSGFMTCVKSLDAMTPEGSDVRSDRGHLHCWAMQTNSKDVMQLLLSLIELNPVETAVDPGLGAEFDALIASISRDAE